MYSQKLKHLIQLDFIPEKLSFVRTFISQILSDLYYKELQINPGKVNSSDYYYSKIGI